jgi:hypothetical protein
MILSYKISEIQALQWFSLIHCTQTGSGAHPPSYPLGTRCCFPRGKAAGACGWLLTSIYGWGQEWWNYTYTPPISFHGIVLNYIIKYWNNFTLPYEKLFLMHIVIWRQHSLTREATCCYATEGKQLVSARQLSASNDVKQKRTLFGSVTRQPLAKMNWEDLVRAIVNCSTS